MPTNRLVNTNFSFLQPASKGMLPASNPSKYGNATSKVINLNNNNWLSDSVVFTVDSAWRYVVHVRNTHNGASSIHIDDVRVYGMNTATYLACDTASGGYRFQFNGKEVDNEGMGGGGSTYDYGFRIYNPQIARFLSVDPLTSSYPWYTPYQFAGNRPIIAIDLDGLEEYYVIRWLDQSGAHQSSEISVWVSGQHAGGQLIDRQIPANTTDAGAVFIYKQIGKNEVLRTEFGELNDIEKKAQLTKVGGYTPKDNHNLEFNMDTKHND